VDALAARRTRDPVLTAAAGSQSEANLASLAAREVPALLADPDLRKRDERLADRDHHTSAPDPLHDTSGTAKTALPLFAPSACTYDAEARTCVCPAGKSLDRREVRNVTNGYVGEHFQGAKAQRRPRRPRCACSSASIHRRGASSTAKRVGTVEPVFGNLPYNKRLDCFTLRGRTKVNGQWLLFCLVHHIEKLTHAGYAASNRSWERCAASRTTRSQP